MFVNPFGNFDALRFAKHLLYSGDLISFLL